MTQDAYWDELGVAWTAIRPDAQIVAPRVKQRLRRQTVFTSVAILAGLPLSLAGAALGVWTIWRGISTDAWFFVTRGIAIAAISLIAGFAAWSYKSAWRDDTQSLAAMIELALSRAEKWRMAIRLGVLSLGIATVLGTVGTVIRIQVGKPSAMPLLPLLFVTALLVFVLFLLHRKANDDIAKYRTLQQLLLDEPR